MLVPGNHRVVGNGNNKHPVAMGSLQTRPDQIVSETEEKDDSKTGFSLSQWHLSIY